MKIAVSYLSSKHKLKETINRINDTTADYIHMDLMDGKYVELNNIKKGKIKKVLNLAKKPLDVHLMMENPSKFIKVFKKYDNVENLFFHPMTEKNSHILINQLKLMNISPGIVINPNEDISYFDAYLNDIDRVLIMSVVPGMGGQAYLKETSNQIKSVIDYKKKHRLHFEIAVDGGINNDTIKNIDSDNIDYIISGSFICQSDDYQKQINLLKEKTD